MTGPDLGPIWLDIPVALAVGVTMVVATIAGGIRLRRHIRNPRPEISDRAFRWGLAAVVAVVVAGSFTGQVWIILLSFALTAAWCAWCFANTAAAITRGDELRALGLYPPWEPWACPVHRRDCRADTWRSEPCEEAEALKIPHPPRPPEEWRS